MLFGKVFKSRPHYVFNYKPRYYNETKERLNALENQYSESNSDIEGQSRLQLGKNQLRGNWEKQKRTSSDQRVIARLAIIVSVLVGVVAYVFEIHKLF